MPSTSASCAQAEWAPNKRESSKNNFFIIVMFLLFVNYCALVVALQFAVAKLPIYQ